MLCYIYYCSCIFMRVTNLKCKKLSILSLLRHSVGSVHYRRNSFVSFQEDGRQSVLRFTKQQLGTAIEVATQFQIKNNRTNALIPISSLRAFRPSVSTPFFSIGVHILFSFLCLCYNKMI